MFTSISRCRLCEGDLRPLFVVDAPRVSTFPLADADLTRLPQVPLSVVQCVACQHVQLQYSVDPQLLYQEYWYESGVNERMVAELAEVVRRATEIAPLDPGDCVLDIGANDGTLLLHYPLTPDLHRVAVEPSASFNRRLREFCDATVQGTFPECLGQIPPNQYKVVTTIAMFYDLRDPVAGAAAIRQLLHAHGVWVCQFQDLEQQTRYGAWDNVCHEHLHYFTLGTFNEVVRRAGLQIVDVERTPINGGSLRVFVQHPHAHGPNPNVQRQYFDEFCTLEHGWAARFDRRRLRNVQQIQAMVASVVDQGGVVDLYGASTKGNTLLQACGLQNHVRAAWERNPRKYGRQTVTGVPIIPELDGRRNPPDALLTTIWQFKAQIVEREQETLRTVPLILPLPEATWVGMSRERAS